MIALVYERDNPNRYTHSLRHSARSGSWVRGLLFGRPDGQVCWAADTQSTRSSRSLGLAHLDLWGSIILPLFLYFSTAGAFVFGWAKPVPYNPYNLRAGKWGPALVGLAGPATNLALAIIFALILSLGASSLSPAFLSICIAIVLTNVVLAVFNLIPVPPLDGSKLLFALLPYKWRGVEEFLNKYQFILIIVLLLFGWRLIEVPVTWLAGLLLGA